MKAYKNCQSFGMPLSKDENGGGIEKDGTRSIMYCSHCYENGEFTLPDLTVDQMKQRVKEKIVEFGMPAFIAVFFTRSIPKLERWKKQ
ncbi:zinc ribbon domain-containing protein [Metabacillus rhizolycopersici]|uniref:Zinc ribbon domain-containing protein n=1 Tax=Metabacillus rhizolycopersici TaxID=2875709 RepID=A0ABS7UVK2_9BACI|nr:zinc ribbon domain-containing protein [Metabacillus rhizolycopersici]MBZ5752330.1 zinc ribbon domain-containing protein [Metabacillus rhizolycopersici]